MGIGIIAIAYSGILYRNETILHIIPMKQSNAFLIVKPYEKTAMVYIDTPDAIPMKASEIRVRNGLQSFGIPLKNAHVQRFQSLLMFNDFNRRAKILFYTKMIYRL